MKLGLPVMSRRVIRCVIYTRKSSQDGLEQEFNSLHAQREACAAYITSQKGEGWVLLTEQYDDGGISGGTLERPALHRLLVDVGEGRVDQIVVYKVDRLTRSLADFAKLVDKLDEAGASFVSVTQSFNTATSMGRLTLNVLLSFAQFEREVTAERIRDKITASKKKGLWMGGNVPLGYDADGRSLRINDEEAETVRVIFDLYLEHGSMRALRQVVRQRGYRSRVRKLSSGRQAGGVLFDIGHLHWILTNPVYAGRIRHKEKVYEGQHKAIIDVPTWQLVQERLADRSTGDSKRSAKAKEPSLLVGKLHDETGDRLTPSHANKRGVRYRYYISHRLIKMPKSRASDGWRLPAPKLERTISDATREHLLATGIAGLIEHPSAAEFAVLSDKLDQLVHHNETEAAPARFLELVERIDIKPGELAVHLLPKLLAAVLEIAEDRIRTVPLAFSVPFRLRKKGVEARFDTGNRSPEIDKSLLHNVAKAHRWFEQLKQGQSFAEIADQEKLSARRVQQLMDHAFLAPDIAKSIITGKQPPALTTDHLQRSDVPANWADQRKLFASLQHQY